MRISHIGIAVKDWEQEVSRWRKFAKIEPEIENVPEQGMKMAIFDFGNARIELIGSTKETSPVHKYLHKRGTSMHHICLAVNDLDSTIEELKAENMEMIDNQPRIGSGGHKIAFIHPKSFDGVLIEISD